MKTLLTLLAVGLLFSTLGCGNLNSSTPTGQLLIGVEKVGVALAVDRLTLAVANDKSLSAAEKAGVTQAVSDLVAAWNHPTTSAAAQAAWDAALPFLSKYSTGPKAVIGPATVAELDSLMQTYVAQLKAAENKPPAPSTAPVTPTWYEALQRA